MQKQLAADKKASRSNTSPLTCRDQARRTKEEWFLDSFLSWLLAKAAIPEGTRKDRPNPSLHPTYTALLFHPSRKARQLKHQAEFSLSQNCWLALPTSTFSEHPKALIFVLTEVAHGLKRKLLQPSLELDGPHLSSGSCCSVSLPSESNVGDLKAEVQRIFKRRFLARGSTAEFCPSLLCPGPPHPKHNPFQSKAHQTNANGSPVRARSTRSVTSRTSRRRWAWHGCCRAPGAGPSL